MSVQVSSFSRSRLAIGRLAPFLIFLNLHLSAVAVGFFLAVCPVVSPAWGESRLPVPRFASLRSSEVNLRTGPGVRYPVEWRYVRQGVPVEIIAEFEHWRKVRDWEGTEGWVHRSMLSGRRTLVITGELRNLRREPSLESAVVSQAEPGVFGRIEKCQGEWCRIEIAGITGWLKRFEFWGVFPDEILE